MYQNLILVGRIGTEPVLRTTRKGQPVVTFQFYTKEHRWNDQGESTPLTTWWHVSMFGEKANVLAKGAHKGSKLLIEGSINPSPDGNPRIFTRKSGDIGASFDVNVRMFRFLEAPQLNDVDSDEIDVFAG